MQACDFQSPQRQPFQSWLGRLLSAAICAAQLCQPPLSAMGAKPMRVATQRGTQAAAGCKCQASEPVYSAVAGKSVAGHRAGDVPTGLVRDAAPLACFSAARLVAVAVMNSFPFGVSQTIRMWLNLACSLQAGPLVDICLLWREGSYGHQVAP